MIPWQPSKNNEKVPIPISIENFNLGKDKCLFKQSFLVYLCRTQFFYSGKPELFYVIEKNK